MLVSWKIMTDKSNICGSTNTYSGDPCQRKTGGELCRDHNQDLLEKHEIDLDEVERLAACGLTLEQIGHYYRISESTFKRMKKENEDLMNSYNAGKAQASANVGKTVFQKAKDGNFQEARFYLKTQADWTEKQKHEIMGEGGGPVQTESENITLDDLTDEAVEKLLEVDDDGSNG